MTGTGRRSFRRRLTILLVLALIPVVVLSVMKARDVRTLRVEQQLTRNLTLARAVAYSVDEYIVSTGGFLQALAQSDMARDGDFDALSTWFRAMLPNYPYYFNILFVDVDGVARATSRPSDSGEPCVLSDTAVLARSLESTGTIVGDFMYSKIGNRPVIHISYPVFGRDGTRMGFIMVGMDLTRMQERIMRTRDDEAATICVLDSRGTVLARNVDPITWIGVDMYEDARVAEMLAQPEGMGEVEGFEGVAQLCAYTRADDVPWFVRVCVDSTSVRSQADAELRGYFAAFLPLTFLALGGWLWLGHDVDRMHRETERLALIDQLTGLWNSRSMRDDITRTFEQAGRSGESFAFMMLDLDDFKSFNDRFGHVAGDEALRLVSRSLQAAVRAADRAYRYGGEEFCVILPATTTEEALIVAGRIGQSVADVPLHPDGADDAVSLTVSIGVAVYPEDATNVDALTCCADDALYRAKREGKNRVVAHCGAGSATS